MNRKDIWEVFEKYHKLIEDNIDLGTGNIIDVTIYNKYAVITDTNGHIYGEEVSINDLNNKLAPDIMLLGIDTPVEFGDWLHNPELPNITNIPKWKEDDFTVNIELLKFWTVLRIICNKLVKEDDNKIHHIYWYRDSEIASYDCYDSIEKFKEDWIPDET